MTPPPAADRSPGTLGTFAGGFTPSILTILGIILFLRLGFVVGSAGLGRALLIIGLASAIALLTTISLSGVAALVPMFFLMTYAFAQLCDFLRGARRQRLFPAARR